MKITILGKGNAGCISAMHFSHFKNILNFPVEIEMIHDSTIEPVPTGQGTLLDFPGKLFECFQSGYDNKFPTTIKTGIMYENFGTKKEKIFHNFPVGKYALHFEPKAFQDFICKNLNINFIEDKNVKQYDEIDSDYIIDCRGTPKDFTNYDKLFNPLNCALLADLPKKENDVKWTRAIATKNGWCFYIPLPERTSVGYVYNKDLTKESDAKKDFTSMFNLEKINHVFPFEQYLAKKPIDKRVMLNGNKLFFLEPLEATAMSTYINVSKFYFDYMFNDVSQDITQNRIRRYVYQIQNFILWHYANGSIYDTLFWQNAKKIWEKTDKEDIEKIIVAVKNMNQQNIEKSLQSNFTYAQWEEWNFKLWYEGVTK